MKNKHEPSRIVAEKGHLFSNRFGMAHVFSLLIHGFGRACSDTTTSPSTPQLEKCNPSGFCVTPAQVYVLAAESGAGTIVCCTASTGEQRSPLLWIVNVRIVIVSTPA